MEEDQTRENLEKLLKKNLELLEQYDVELEKVNAVKDAIVERDGE